MLLKLKSATQPKLICKQMPGIKKFCAIKNLGLFRSATRKISADFALIGAGKNLNVTFVMLKQFLCTVLF